MRSITALVIAMGVAACGGTGENIDKEACTYLQAGGAAALTAGTMMDAAAPAIEATQQAWTITLPASGPGYLSFESKDDTEYAVVMDRNVAIKVLAPTGTEIPPQAMSTRSDVCVEIKGRHIIELQVATFFFELGPDSGGPVTVVLLPYNPD